jgi:hypothetical protein
MPAPDEGQWASLIREVTDQSQFANPPRAVQYAGQEQTASQPRHFLCDDGEHYLVKFANNPHGDGRATVAEQIVARCGATIGAPVPRVETVEVPADLLSVLGIVFPTGPATAGLHHGSRWEDGFSARQSLAYFESNRAKFGALDVLYAWLLCTGDHQWIYRNAEPHDVLSVDHTSFLPGGQGWTAQGLQANKASVSRDPIVSTLNLTHPDRAETLALLDSVDEADIARIVIRPPDTWGITIDERIALAAYLWERRDGTLRLFRGGIP